MAELIKFEEGQIQKSDKLSYILAMQWNGLIWLGLKQQKIFIFMYVFILFEDFSKKKLKSMQRPPLQSSSRLSDDYVEKRIAEFAITISHIVIALAM